MNIHHLKYLLRFLPAIAKYLSVCILLIPSLSYSQENILVVMSGDQEIYQEFYSKLTDKLAKNNPISKINSSEINNEILNKYGLIITVGFQASIMVSKLKVQQTVIYSLIPDDGVSQASITCENKSCYKVFINQPISRYVSLFKVIFPKGKSLAFVVTKENKKTSLQLEEVLKTNVIAYKAINISQDSNITQILINTLSANDILLALPDVVIYNASTAKNIILSTYHKNVPIIAYSKSFAKAGALISLYSSIDNVANKTANVVTEIINNGPRSEKEYYPDDFTIETNSAVARSLNIEIDSEDIIKRNMK